MLYVSICEGENTRSHYSEVFAHQGLLHRPMMYSPDVSFFACFTSSNPSKAFDKVSQSWIIKTSQSVMKNQVNSLHRTGINLN